MENVTQSPTVSVIVPIYNVETYLKRCINSIINQTYRNLEIILVNDGSSDKSAEICDEFQQKDRRIKVIHKENGGLVSARKAGIQIASGVYVTHLDSDDWIEPDMYEELVCLIVQNDADIITSGLYRDYQNGSIKVFDNLPEGIYDVKRLEKEILPELIYTGTFFKTGINIHICNKLFRRELALDNQLKINDYVKTGEDAAFIYPCVIDAKKIIITHKCFYHYCIRPDSMMGTGYRNELLGFRYVYEVIKDKIDQYGKYTKILETQLNFLMLYELLIKEPWIVIRNDNGILIPYENVKITDKIVLYGGGKFGRALYSFLKRNELCEVVLWVDKSENNKLGIEDPVRLRELSDHMYDKVVISVLEGSASDEIYAELMGIGIENEKIARMNLNHISSDIINLLYGEK